MRNIKQCEAGDIIADRGGNKAKVLAILGPIIFRSEFYRFDILAQQHMTLTEAKEQGWVLLTPDGKTPMSKKEVESLLGNVKITE